MNKRGIKIILVIIFFLICLISIQKISYSTLQSKDKAVNLFNLGDINIEVCEKFESPKNWDGRLWPKKVKIKNNSKSKALIRVSIIPRWVDNSGNSWIGDTSFVTLNYENIISNFNNLEDDKWIYGNDNYFYYNSIVERGKETKALLKSVELDIPKDLKERYKNKTLVVDVKAEAVQATKDAYKKSWTAVQSKEIINILDKLCIR